VLYRAQDLNRPLIKGGALTSLILAHIVWWPVDIQGSAIIRYAHTWKEVDKVKVKVEIEIFLLVAALRQG
jgi:hypothetical protein